MAKKEKEGIKSYYICKECNLAYKDKKLAERCQKWCSEHKSCNIEIIKYAINNSKTK